MSQILTNKLQISKLQEEMKLLWSFVIGILGRDKEGKYNQMLVQVFDLNPSFLGFPFRSLQKETQKRGSGQRTEPARRVNKNYSYLFFCLRITTLCKSRLFQKSLLPLL